MENNKEGHNKKNILTLLGITSVLLFISNTLIYSSSQLIKYSVLSIGSSKYNPNILRSLLEAAHDSQRYSSAIDIGQYFPEEINFVLIVCFCLVIGFFLLAVSQLVVSSLLFTIWKQKKEKHWLIIVVVLNVIGFIVSILILSQTVEFWDIWAILYLISVFTTMASMIFLIDLVQKDYEYIWLPRITKVLYGISAFYFLISIIGMVFVDGYIFAIPASILSLFFVILCYKSNNLGIKKYKLTKKDKKIILALGMTVILVMSLIIILQVVNSPEHNSNNIIGSWKQDTYYVSYSPLTEKESCWEIVLNFYENSSFLYYYNNTLCEYAGTYGTNYIWGTYEFKYGEIWLEGTEYDHEIFDGYAGQEVCNYKFIDDNTLDLRPSWPNSWDGAGKYSRIK